MAASHAPNMRGDRSELRASFKGSSHLPTVADDVVPNSAHLVKDRQMENLDKISDNLARSRQSLEELAERRA